MTKFRFLTAGESHGQGLNVILEGIPSNLPITENYIEKDMSRRQKGYGSGGRMKIEKDRAEIKSGVRHGKTLGSPISLWIENKDWANWTIPMSVEEVGENEDIKRQTKIVPGHADFPGTLKFNHKDVRNVLERASARETAARVAAASICKKFLFELGINIKSWVKSVGWEKSDITNIDLIDWNFVENSEVRASSVEDDERFKQVIDKAKKERTTIGGVFQVIASGVPLGLGSHTQWDKKLDGKIAQSMISINAVKGIEVGNGFENTQKFGNQVQDIIEPNMDDIRNFSQKSNHAGGIEGGMSNGNSIIVNVAIKPIATMTRPLPSVDIITGEVVEAAYNRSDICQVSRACPVGEAMLAITITEEILEKFGGDSLQEIKRNYSSYIKTFKEYGNKK
jgi:chorismate synthase